jgi:hypothetical protein
MTFQCPKCNINLSDDEYLNLSGRHTKENYLIKCPHCSQESFSNQSDKPYWKRLEGDFEFYSYTPKTLAQCENTCCMDCAYQKENLDYIHDSCPYQDRIKGENFQSALSQFMTATDNRRESNE